MKFYYDLLTFEEDSMKLKDATCDRNDASNIELVESTYMDKDSDTFF